MQFATLVITAAGTIAALLVFWKSGRVKNARQFAGAVVVILLAAVGLGFLEARAEREARALLASVFPAPPGSEELVFRRKATKGTPTQEVEAIYRIRSDDPVPVTLEGAAFRYGKHTSVSKLGVWTIDRFAIADGALDWKPLPRQYFPGRHFPARGHASSSNLPYEKGMTGSYLCAFVLLDPDNAEAPQKVVPCETVDQRPPPGITLLAVQDTSAGMLHVVVR